ncbi:ATPase [Croceicoccus sp. F390]|uniref:ATP synthase subunit b n=1 Tax=Croceicoccus esteveae TaxID=3075597 RepID=A0ABU2ZJ77_9SPHN|nr:ATPase [Croceicoccus sp. F390]MDT0576656.1 ATPase [Croceicoccus sp. F390]
MPQIEQIASTYASQIFWLLVIFGLVFFVIGKGMIPKVMSTVDMRDRQISQDLTAAQAARTKADEEEEVWRKRENDNRAQAQALIAEAKAEAALQAQGELQSAQAGIDAKLDQAEARIMASRQAAAAEIDMVAAEATQQIVARIAAIAVTPQDARQAVKEAMVHVG